MVIKALPLFIWRNDMPTPPPPGVSAHEHGHLVSLEGPPPPSVGHSLCVDGTRGYFDVVHVVWVFDETTPSIEPHISIEVCATKKEVT